MNTQVNANELKQKINIYLEELARETDLSRKSAEMQRYLDFCAKFHHYSPSNIFLILLTMPEATQVAGFESWKKMGRFVKKGEHGIPILAPLIHKEDPADEDSAKVLSGFKVVHVFDLSQTDGEPFPAAPDWKSPEKNVELNEKLIKFAESKGITVTFTNLSGETQGLSRGGAIEIDHMAGTKTLIHEIAHELMHQCTDSFKSTVVRELEAESVAFIVSRFFGLRELKSANYLALHRLNSQDFFSILARIQEVSRSIISGINFEMYHV